MKRLLFAALAGLVLADPAEAQIRLSDLVVNGGLAAEGYRGNFSAVTVARVDSTESAAAGIGEFGVRGTLSFLPSTEPGSRSLALNFDLGLRQFNAMGFQIRDYAPREWSSNLHLDYRQSLGSGSLRVGGGLRGRGIHDRPPMPLFLQPAYETLEGEATYVSGPLGDVRFDLGVTGARSDYGAPQILPQLDLLDRNMVGVELGASSVGLSNLRLFGVYRRYHYPQQGSFDRQDPFRSDDAFHAGAKWTMRRPSDAFMMQLGVDGILNRSNSRRMEYDAVRFSLLATTALGDNYMASLYGVLTAKRYLFPTEDARLVPGEEADNASVIYLELTRVLALNLDGSVRVGWTRAETDIGGAYYRRFGASFMMKFRPLY